MNHPLYGRSQLARLADAASGGTNQYGIALNAKDYADQTQAYLARREFDDFLMTGLPLLQQQVGQVGNEGYLSRVREEARSNAAQQLSLSQAARDSRLASYGVQLTPDQAAGQAKRDRITAALTDVDAFNRSTQQVRDRDWMLLSGGRSPLSVLEQQR